MFAHAGRPNRNRPLTVPLRPPVGDYRADNARGRDARAYRSDIAYGPRFTSTVLVATIGR